MMDFTQILPVLEAHPDVVVTRGTLLPGASDAQVQVIEERLGVSLHPSIRSFYQAHNGLVVEWICKYNQHFSSQSWERNDAELPFLMDLFDDYSPPVDGQAIFLPLESVFPPDYDQPEVNGDWGEGLAWSEFIGLDKGVFQGDFSFSGKTYAAEIDFRSELRLLDFHLRDSGVLMRLEPGNGDCPVFFLDGSWDNFQEEAQLGLSRYLESVTSNLGLRWDRHRYFHPHYQLSEEEDPAARLEVILSQYAN